MLRNIRKPLGLAIILTVLMVLLPMGVMAAPVGKISHLEGEADVTAPDGKTVLVKLADPVSVGDILRTKAKSKVEVTFPDGNTIFLAERSRLRISEYENKEDSKSYFELFRGKTRVVVNNIAKKSAIELHTPTAVAGVRGTIWIGSFENGVSEFYFERGVGYGYSKQRPDVVVTIRAGQTMTVISPDQLPIVRPAPVYEINRQQMDTTATPLEEQTPAPSAPVPGPEEAPPPPPPPPLPPPEMPPPPPPPPVPPPPPPPSTEPIAPAEPQTSLPPVAVSTGNFAGTFSGSISDTSDSGTLSLAGSFTAAGPADIVLSGSPTADSSYDAYLVGIPGSWEGLFDGLYWKGDTVKFLTGEMSDPAFTGTTLNATGTIVRSVTAYPTVGSLTSFPNIGMPVFADISAGAQPTSAFGVVSGYQTPAGGIIGIGRTSSTGGTYGFIAPSWTGTYGYYGGGATPFFFLGDMAGTDDGAGHITLTGSNLTYMDQYYYGALSLRFLGTYSGASYDTVGTGVYRLDPLAYSSVVGYGGFAYWDSSGIPDYTVFEDAFGNLLSPVSGVFAGTGSLFAGFIAATGQYQPASLIGMGSYAPATASNYRLWGLKNAGSAGSDARFITVYGGIRTGDSLLGRGLGLYVKGMADPYETGVISSTEISATLYPDLALWQSGGSPSLTATKLGTTALTPAELAVMDANGDYVNLTRNMFTAPIGDGAITGEVSGDALFIPDQSWGIMYFGTGGNYAAVPAGNWSARVGKGETGSYVGYWYNNYWIGTVTGGAWDAGTNSFSAAMTGRELNVDSDGDNYLATFSADILGTYDGTQQYQGIGLGTITSTPLAYNGYWRGGGYDGTIWYPANNLLNNNSGAMVYAGDAPGMLGGIDPPWSDTADFTVMGKYSYEGGASDSGTYLWASFAEGGKSFPTPDVAGYNYYNGYFTTKTIGLWKGSDHTLEGAISGIYITPADGDGKVTAGFLGGNISGNYYPGIGMWAVLGNSIAPTAMTTDMQSEIFSYDTPNIGGSYLTAALDGSFSGTSGSIQGRDLPYYIQAGATSYLFKSSDYSSLPWGAYTLYLQNYGYNDGTYTYNTSNLFSVHPGGNSPWSAIIGGEGVFGDNAEKDYGYWLATLKGTWSDTGEINGTLGTISGDSATFGKYITLNYAGDIRGPFFGIADPPVSGSGTWIGVSTGSYSGSELVFGGGVTTTSGYSSSGSFHSLNFSGYAYYFYPTGSIDGLWGITDPLNNGSHMLMLGGIYDTYSVSNPFPSLFTADIGNYYSEVSGTILVGGTSSAGFAGGTFLNRNIDAAFSGFYAKPISTGYELGFLAAADLKGYSLIEPAINISPPPEALTSVSGNWMASGSVSVLKMEDTATSIPTSFPVTLDDEPYITVPLTNEITGGADIQLGAERLRMNAFSSSSNWGILQVLDGGPYFGTIPSATDAVKTAWTMSHTQNTLYQAATTTWNTTTNTISGQAVLAIADWTSATTMVAGGTIKGVFDPSAPWQTVTTGAWIETGKFLQMQGGATSDVDANATLKALNIPAYQVGQATLTQEDPTTPVNNLTHVTMNNVTFFAPSTGAPPSIWATNGVAGNYSAAAAPAAGGPTVPLAGDGLTANFGISNWNAGAGTWVANVTGSGTLSGGAYTGTVDFKGGAAGTISAPASSFSGTAAGIVK